MRTIRTAALAAVFALPALITGCTAGPNYKRPEAPVPATFKEAGKPGEASPFRPAEPRDAERRGPWWEVYGDPELSRLEARIDVSNQTLAQAEAQYRGARALAREARAGLFPTVTAGASATRSRVESGRQGGGTSYQLPVDLTYEADVWGRIRRTLEAGTAAAQASAADLEAARLSLQAELAADYFQLRGSDAERQLLDSTVAAFTQALELTRRRHDQGIVSGVDVAQAETALETTRAAATDLGAARAGLEHAIATLTGVPPAELDIEPVPAPLAAPVALPAVLPSDLLQRRPDVAAAERRMAAANAQVGVARSAYFPAITLSASGGTASSAIADLLSWPNRVWSLGAALVETVVDGGRRRAATAAAETGYDGAVAAYRQTVLASFQEVEDQLATLRVLAQESKEQAAAVAAAERALALAQNRYQGGLTAYLEVLTAQSAALASRRAEVGIATRRLVASVGLVRALGGDWSGSLSGEQLPPAGAVPAPARK